MITEKHGVLKPDTEHSSSIKDGYKSDTSLMYYTSVADGGRFPAYELFEGIDGAA